MHPKLPADQVVGVTMALLLRSRDTLLTHLGEAHARAVSNPPTGCLLALMQASPDVSPRTVK